VAHARRLPDGELTFFNIHTNERLQVQYRDYEGNYDLTALDEVNHILRCHHTGEVAAIDVRMLEHVNFVQKAVASGGEIHVISAYRSPMSRGKRSISIFLESRFGRCAMPH
jgi:uncharacterized protein YcbK (DUF882 family)